MSAASSKRLGERDRRFFSLVARAAFANPFSAERAQLDAEIGDTDAADPHVLARVTTRLAGRLENLEQGGLTFAQYPDDERELLFAAVLFAAFHRFIEDIDRLIAAPTPVRFARPLFAELTRRGVAKDQAQRALELFYQMRRAHLAIGRRLLGAGPSMQKLREALWNSVFTYDILRYERYLWNRMEDFSILLLGETGTGKGEAARALGRAGYIPFDEKRAAFTTSVEELFVPLNLSEFPETLIESELFGHRRGAFTGAIDHHAGALSRVLPHGTLFLDEIGEVNQAIQVKLLRVLQDRAFTPVGAHEHERFHGRVVAATHRPLSALRSAGAMRDDFYYRVATHTIEVPNLRTRLAESPGELATLVGTLCERITGEASPELAARVEARIEQGLGRDYAFPGNVRELEQCVRRVLLTGGCRDDGRALTSATDVLGAGVAQDPLVGRMEHGELAADELVRAYCERLYARSKSYVQVAKVTGLDRRTVRRHLTSSK